MKLIILLIVGFGALLTTALRDNAPADLRLTVSIVTGEHSRDSNSTTTDLTVSDRTLSYDQTYQGARAGRRVPVKKQYKLTNEDISNLIGVLNKKNLWVTKSVSKPAQQKGTSFYFELTIRADLNEKHSSVSIDGSRSDSKLRDDVNFQHAVSLIDELYRVIRRTDPDVSTPRLIEVER